MLAIALPSPVCPDVTKFMGSNDSNVYDSAIAVFHLTRFYHGSRVVVFWVQHIHFVPRSPVGRNPYSAGETGGDRGQERVKKFTFLRQVRSLEG